MKLYISCDIEGIAGLASFGECSPADPAYPPMAREMSLEAAAACRGFLSSGPAEIVVEDAHHSGQNILMDLLPKEVLLLRGITGELFGVGGHFDASFDGIAFIGAHSGAGSDASPVAHTMVSSTVFQIEVNGMPFTEFHHLAWAAARIGVPAVLVSGDAGICRVAERDAPGILTVEAKSGGGASVLSLSPACVQEQIERAAEKAAGAIGAFSPISLPDHFLAEVTYIRHHNARSRSHYPGARQTGSHTIAFETDDYTELLRFFHFVI